MDQNQPAQQPAPAANSSAPAGKNTTMAFLAYIIFFIPLLTDSKNDPFVKFHVKQSLGLLLIWVAVSVLVRLLWILWTVMPILQLALFILWVLGVINALQGKQKALPLIGEYFEKINI